MTTPTGPSEVGDAPEGPESDGTPEADEHETNESEFLEQMSQHHNGSIIMANRYLSLPHHKRTHATTNYARHVVHQRASELDLLNRLKKKHA